MLGSPQVAIVGMACRFPGAAHLEAFWAMLCGERSALGAAPRGRRLPAQAPRWGGFLADPTRFDADYFGISEADVPACAPEQRLALEVVQDSLEDAGLLPTALAGSNTGVFACGGNLARGPESLAQRLAALHDLRGPNLLVEAGSVSTHMGVHLAAQSLLRGECAQALVVAAALIRPGAVERWLGPASALSMQGRGAAFDASADGTIWGEGAGCLILKPLDAAEANGDRIYAVIRGTSVAHQGRHTAHAAQAEVIRAAYAAAQLAPQAAEYAEAHAAGWPDTDRREAQTLSRTLGHGRVADRPLYLGTVKNNVGHLGVASGMASFIKVALALQHRSLPATVQVPQPIDLSGLRLAPAGTPVQVASVCGASATGHHAHAVLSAPPQPLTVSLGDFGGTRLLPLSAASPAALRSLVERHAQALEQAPVPLADWCATASLARAPQAVRVAATGRTRAEMARALRALHVAAAPSPAPCVWAFGDVAAHPANPALSLPLQQPVFRRAFDEVEAAILRAGGPALGPALRRLGSGFMQASPALAQPLVFAQQVALARLWTSWGVEPAGLWGWGVGAWAAAHVASVVTLADAAQAVWQRGQLFATLQTTYAPPGTGAELPAQIAARLSERLHPQHPQAAVVPLWLGAAATQIANPAHSLDAAFWGAQALMAATPLVPPDPSLLLHLGSYTDPRLPMAVHSLDAHQDAGATLQQALGQLWTGGINPAWGAVDTEPHPRVQLPSYPWQGKDYPWDGPGDGAVSSVAEGDSAAAAALMNILLVVAAAIRVTPCALVFTLLRGCHAIVVVVPPPCLFDPACQPRAPAQKTAFGAAAWSAAFAP